MDTQHRKIELQSPSDLTYLTTQIRTAAARKLDLHLPPVPSSTEPDDLRKHVETLIDDFVAQILAGMRRNISINGMEVQTEDDGPGVGGAVDGKHSVFKEEYEPFDEKLRARVGAAIVRRDALVGKISRHRRNTPAMAAMAFQSQFQRENEELLDVDVDTGEGQGDVVGVLGLQREEEVRRNWERAVEGLGRLNGGMGETRARLERAGGVVEYLEGEKRKV
ncbi:hypothetical protein BDU57DRAFT_516457 [Ampelomyces quisqualis]|uniref:Kinetochore protein mis14 n=1 Tax=Ampelomyces quisqualis TaxID=50730 RepID=A0A6A5QLA0_AMPQU|nr:hypothetical protein BDU57DRAFT_516457 [Ampelomyces quisqualis]